MNGMVDLLVALGPFITALTPIVLPVVMWLVNRQQTKTIKSHSDENREAISRRVDEATGVFRTLSVKDPP